MLVHGSCFRSREFSVGFVMDTELDHYTVQISHSEDFCDTGLDLWQYKHYYNSFAILLLWQLILLQRLHHRLRHCVERAFLCAMICIQANVTTEH